MRAGYGGLNREGVPDIADVVRDDPLPPQAVTNRAAKAMVDKMRIKIRPMVSHLLFVHR
jgi:hypothetical protein